MSRFDLFPQQRNLSLVQTRAKYRTKVGIKVGGRDWGDQSGDVGEGAVEGGDWSVPEVVSLGDGLHEVERRVTSSNYGHGTALESGCVYTREIAGGASG